MGTLGVFPHLFLGKCLTTTYLSLAHILNCWSIDFPGLVVYVHWLRIFLQSLVICCDFPSVFLLCRILPRQTVIAIFLRPLLKNMSQVVTRRNHQIHTLTALLHWCLIFSACAMIDQTTGILLHIIPPLKLHSSILLKLSSWHRDSWISEAAIVFLRVRHVNHGQINANPSTHLDSW